MPGAEGLFNIHRGDTYQEQRPPDPSGFLRESGFYSEKSDGEVTRGCWLVPVNARAERTRGRLLARAFECFISIENSNEPRFDLLLVQRLHLASIPQYVAFNHGHDHV